MISVFPLEFCSLYLYHLSLFFIFFNCLSIFHLFLSLSIFQPLSIHNAWTKLNLSGIISSPTAKPGQNLLFCSDWTLAACQGQGMKLLGYFVYLYLCHMYQE
ncbi:hypothetical protein ATANTOWER_010234 [Ataeniobius toweri]|uniref:Uncharacterized protein n=1 Tax=Ataeniobius toweri TaxID=208326 RepID=A0ABU7A657_9TELE|nr:hypothetical protein [Ataeniobius toweri]